MHEQESPLNARSVALRLGVHISTLNCWLASDEERRPENRRFGFHRYRGRKRVWTIAAFNALKLAIEAESEPGGCLGGWRRGADKRETTDDGAASEALDQVLAFQVRDRAANQSAALIGINGPRPEATEDGQCPPQ